MKCSSSTQTHLKSVKSTWNLKCCKLSTEKFSLSAHIPLKSEFSNCECQKCEQENSHIFVYEITKNWPTDTKPKMWQKSPIEKCSFPAHIPNKSESASCFHIWSINNTYSTYVRTQNAQDIHESQMHQSHPLTKGKLLVRIPTRTESVNWEHLRLEQNNHQVFASKVSKLPTVRTYVLNNA